MSVARANVLGTLFGLRRSARHALARRLYRRPIVVKLHRPLVSISFDDFPRSAASVAAPLLEARGFRGTYYASFGLMDTETELGLQFGAEDAARLVAAGHELACHTHDHLRCSQATPEAFAGSVEKNAERLSQLFPGLTFSSFAFPGGDLDVAHKGRVRDRFSSLRGIDPGVNAGRVDLCLLRANALYRLDANELERLLGLARKLGGWLILYTHDVSGTPSPWGSTPEAFEHALDRIARSGCEVATVRDAVIRILHDAGG